MTITAICLLKLPQLPLPSQGPVRAEALEDSVLLHTGLDFSDDPADLAGAVRTLLGEPLASQHDDARGLFLIPSVAAPSARSYDAVIAEVAEGGVWAPWAPWATLAPLTAAQAPDLAGMLSGMLGQMPEGLFAQAAASLRDNPDALRQASAQLPELFASPGAVGELLQQGSSQLPELADMLRAMGLHIGAGELSQLTSDLQAELSRDPARLVALAESLFAGEAGDGPNDVDDTDGEDDTSGKAGA